MNGSMEARFALARWKAARRRRRLWAAVLVLMLLAVVASVVAVIIHRTASHNAVDLVARMSAGSGSRLNVPELPDLEKPGVLPITPQQARLLNSQTAISAVPVEAAAPFRLSAQNGDLFARASAIDCLTAAVYYEAASESLEGQRAVAQVILNRMRHPAYPHSVCGVVYQGAERVTGCQFSFTCDGSLARRPSQNGWAVARAVAIAALNGFIERSVGTATHYHADYVVPYWASTLDKVATIGAHIFYRWRGYWGQRRAFGESYAGESQMPVMPSLAGDSDAFEVGTTVIVPTPVPTGPRPRADDAGILLAPRQDSKLPGGSVLQPDNPGLKLKADEAGGQLIEPNGRPTKLP